MSKARIQIVSLLALTLVSCAREVAEENWEGLVATMETPTFTKVSLEDPVPGEQFGVFTWDDDTRISIHTNTGRGSYVIARMVEKSADGKTATFRPTLTGTRDGYAIFPITAADGGYPGVDERGFRVIWHKEHYIKNTGASWKEHYTVLADTPMAAVNDPSSNTLQFKHLGGILRLHVDQIPSNTKYLKIRSLDPDPVIQGSFIVDMSGAKPVVTPVSGEVGRSVNFVFSNVILSGVSEAAGAMNNVVLNLPVPPGTYNALRVEAWKETGNSYDYPNDNICRYICDPVTVDCGQVADVEVPMHRTIYTMIVNPLNGTSYSSSNAYVEQDINITTLLRPVKVPYYLRNQTGSNLDPGSTYYGDVHLTCTTDDPSVAQVYVTKNGSENPQIYVFGVAPGSTKLHVWARRRGYDEEVHGSQDVIVSPSSTFTVISPTTSMDQNASMNLTVSSVPEGAGDRTLDYTWQIVSRSGASDASIVWDKQKAVLSSGSELGWVDINCSISYNGSTPVTSATLKILIGNTIRPDGTVNGLFKVSDTKLVFFARANLYSTKAEPDKFRFTEYQYDIMYSKDPNWSDSYTEIPYSFAEYDLFHRDVAMTTFGDAASSPEVYWNNNDTQTSPGWYLLSGDEWKYLLETRRASTVAGTADARYLRVRIGVHFGVVIFPDTYIHPVSVQAIPGGRVNVANGSAIDLCYEEWEDMERAGAVFLPCTGIFQKASRHAYLYHNSIASSWSRDGKVFHFRVAPFNAVDNTNTDNYDTPKATDNTYYYPIRLVKDMY